MGYKQLQKSNNTYQSPILGKRKSLFELKKNNKKLKRFQKSVQSEQAEPAHYLDHSFFRCITET